LIKLTIIGAGSAVFTKTDCGNKKTSTAKLGGIFKVFSV
jgi:hypothetical protein